MRLRWYGEGEPTLEDVALETAASGSDPEELQRAFLVVGVEEPSRGRTWGVVLERIDYNQSCAMEVGGARVWCFYREPRAA